MKKLLTGLLVLSIAFSAIMCGCTNDEKAGETKPSETSASSEASKNDNQESSKKVLTKYCQSFVKGNNPLYGTWLIDGMDIPYFIFRNDNLGEMVMGAEGNFASLTLDTENKKLAATFILGINGSYDYKLSDDGKLLVLTGESETLNLIKQKDYDFIPKAPKNPKIDKDILGWWKAKNGMIYYFGSDGIMYSNQISMETFYTYEAENGKIDAVYDYMGDVKVEMEYSYTNGTLKVEGSKCTPYDPFK